MGKVAELEKGVSKPGEYTPPKGKIPVVTKFGQVVTVPEEQREQAISEGARQATREEYNVAKREQEFGGTQGKLVAGASAALSGATLGLTDDALRMVAPTAADTVSASREANPKTSMGAEIGGLIAATAATGGAGATSGVGRTAQGAAKVISSPVRAAMSLGSKAGGAAARGAEALGLGKTATAVARTATQMGLENAIFSAAHEVSESSLKDTDLVAENVLSSAGEGFLLGSLLGGGGYLVGKGAKAALTPLAGKVAKLAGKGETESLSQFFERKANNKIFDALGPNGKAIRKANEVLGGTENIGASLKNQSEEILGHAPKSTDNLRELVEKGLPKREAEFDALLTKADELSSKTGKLTTVNDAVAAIDNRMAQMSQTYAPQSAINALGQMKEDIFRARGLLDATGNLIKGAEAEALSLRELKEISKQAAERGKLNAFTPELAPQKEAFSGLRRDLEDLLQSRTDDILGVEGGGTFEKYNDVKSKLKALYTARDVLSKAEESAQSRSPFSQTLNNLAGMGTQAVVGAGVSQALGGDPMAGMAAGLAAKGLNKVAGNMVRNYADAFAGRVFGKMAYLSNMVETAGRVGMQADETASRFLTGKVPKSTAKEAVSRTALTKEELREVINSVKDQTPEAAAQIAERVVGKRIVDEQPRLAQSLMGAVNRTIRVLAEAAPRPINAPMGSTLAVQQPRYSDTDMNKFARTYEAAIGGAPEIARQLERGDLTLQSVKAFREVQPAAYAQLQSSIQRGIDKLNEQGLLDKMPYNKLQQLTILFDVPAVGTLSQDFRVGIQQMYADKAKKSQQGQGSGGGQAPGSSSEPSNNKARNMPSVKLDFKAKTMQTLGGGLGSVRG